MRLKYEKCMASRAFKDPLQHINEEYIKLDMSVKSMQNSILNKLKDSQSEAKNIISKLDTLSPLKTLTRGYCIVQSDKKVIKSVKNLEINQQIDLLFSDGNVKAKVI